MIDKSGRRDVLQLRAGVKVIRLFYDDTDALKPYVAKTYGVPAVKLGKIAQPIYKSAKWLSATELQIDCASSVPLGDAEHEFDFTAVIDTTGKLVTATIVKGAVISKPTPRPKATPSKTKTKVKSRRGD
jgi:hypothetical protein